MVNIVPQTDAVPAPVGLQLDEPSVARMCDLERVLEPLARWCVEEREADREVVPVFRPQAVGLVQQLDLGS